jgi:excisionase family DNA binding protein
MTLPGYETTQQAAERLGLTDSRIRQLAIDGRLQGALKIGTMWFIPIDAVAEDRRRGRPEEKG